jgi:hypothetical protein
MLLKMKMNLKPVFLLAIACIVFSCNNQRQQSATNEKPGESNLLNCYQYINNNDTIILKTVNVKGFITGTLVYNLYEKDKNKGTIQGSMKGDVLIADYTFFSEGMKSVRQVAFKKIGSNFIEGYGDVEDKNGKMIFKNPDSLTFSKSVILRPFDCKYLSATK